MTMRVVVVMVMVAGMVAILVMMMMTAPSVYLEHRFSTLTAC